MAADGRFTLAAQLRAVVATALYYPQQALLVPVEMISGGGDYMLGLKHAIADEEVARKALAAQAERALRVDQLEAENRRLRGLLALDPALLVRAQAAQILYEASDPYSRKVVIDRGVASKVVLGSPVINESGVLGQVTRIYPLSSEVTLLTDKDAAIPVLNERTQARTSRSEPALVEEYGLDGLYGVCSVNRSGSSRGGYSTSAAQPLNCSSRSATTCEFAKTASASASATSSAQLARAGA